MFKKILIVDDSLTARVFLKKCLDAAGLGDSEYYEASNGEDALNKMKNIDVDLILTDINMPVMDGRRFLRRIRSSIRFNEIPVIVISSIAGEEEKNNLKNNGATAVISKPMSPMMLLEVLDSIKIDY